MMAAVTYFAGVCLALSFLPQVVETVPKVRFRALGRGQVDFLLQFTSTPGMMPDAELFTECPCGAYDELAAAGWPSVKNPARTKETPCAS